MATPQKLHDAMVALSQAKKAKGDPNWNPHSKIVLYGKRKLLETYMPHAKKPKIEQVQRWLKDAGILERYGWEESQKMNIRDKRIRMIDLREKIRASIPPLPRFDHGSDDRIDIFVTTANFDCGPDEPVAMHLFGKDARGRTIMMRVHDYHAYIVVQKPESWTQSCVQTMVSSLEAELRNHIPKKWSRPTQTVFYPDKSKALASLDRLMLGWKLTKGKPLWANSSDTDFVEIALSHPRLVEIACVCFQAPRGGKVPNRVHENNDHHWDEPRKWTSKSASHTSVSPWLPSHLPLKSFNIYNANVDHVLGFFADSNMQPASWLTTTVFQHNTKTKWSRCDVEVNVRWRDLSPSSDPVLSNTVPPLRMFSWDIECLPLNGRFPNPKDLPVLCIACLVADLGSQVPPTEYLFMLGHMPKNSIPNTHVFYYDYSEEKKMLEDFYYFRLRCRFNIETAYNGANYDTRFVAARCKVLGCNVDFMDFAMIPGKTAKIKTKTSRDGKMLHYVTGDGIVFHDMMNSIIVAGMKLSDFSLQSAASEILSGMTKEEFSWTQIEESSKTDAGRIKMGSYCCTDARLPYLMFVKRNALATIVQGSRVFNVLMEDVVNRGTEHKVLGRILRKLRNPSAGESVYYIPTLRGIVGVEQIAKGGYEGGLVLETIPGFYELLIIAVGDFMSLYPSVMIAFNICYSTVYRMSDLIKMGMVEDTDFWVPREIDTIDPKTLEPTYKPIEEDPWCFLRPKIRIGVLPKMEIELKDERGRIKKQMRDVANKLESRTDLLLAAVHQLFHPESTKQSSEDCMELARSLREKHPTISEKDMEKMITEKDPVRTKLSFDRTLLDEGQIKVKEYMNGIYGFTSNPNGILVMVAIAAAITMAGRNFIKLAKAYAEQMDWGPVSPGEEANREAAELRNELLFKSQNIRSTIFSDNLEMVQSNLRELEDIIIRSRGKDRIVAIQERIWLRIIYGDTDSIFMELNGVHKNINISKSLFRRVTQDITNRFEGDVMVLQFEKLYENMLVSYMKKQYGGWKTVENSAMPYKEIKGITYIKRGTIGFVRKCMESVTNKLFSEGDVQGSIQHVKEMIHSLFAGTVPYHDLVVSRRLSAHPLQYAKLDPAVAVSIRYEDPENPVSNGATVEWVMVESNSKTSGGKKANVAENPEVAFNENMRLDPIQYLHFIEKQLICIMGPVLGAKTVEDAKKRVHEVFLSGVHTLFTKKESVVSTSSSMNRFLAMAKPKPQCLACRCLLSDKDLKGGFGLCCEKCSLPQCLKCSEPIRNVKETHPLCESCNRTRERALEEYTKRPNYETCKKRSLTQLQWAADVHLSRCTKKVKKSFDACNKCVGGEIERIDECSARSCTYWRKGNHNAHTYAKARDVKEKLSSAVYSNW
jgi:DNA polymerase elongation subunit (family B)